MAAKVKYNPDYHDNWAWSLAAMGATNEEIAKAMGVSKRTIIRWSQDHESFGSALAQGKGVSDAKVIRSLYQRAVGYEYEEEKKIIEYDKDGNVKAVNQPCGTQGPLAKSAVAGYIIRETVQIDDAGYGVSFRIKACGQKRRLM